MICVVWNTFRDHPNRQKKSISEWRWVPYHFSRGRFGEEADDDVDHEYDREEDQIEIEVVDSDDLWPSVLLPAERFRPDEVEHQSGQPGDGPGDQAPKCSLDKLKFRLPYLKSILR